MQAFDAIEDHVQSAREDTSTSLLGSALDCVCLAGIGDAVGEEQPTLAFQNVPNQRQSGFLEELWLLRRWSEYVGERVDGRGVDCRHSRVKAGG